MIASVCLQNVTYSIDKLYDYKVPAELAESLMVGCRVLVPFGRGNNDRNAIVISLKLNDCQDDCQASKLKEIKTVLDTVPFYTPKMIGLAEFMKERTFCTLFDALKIMHPGSTKIKTDVTVKMVRPNTENLDYEQLKRSLTKKQEQVLLELEKIGACSVKELCYFTGVTVSVVNTLFKKGVVSFYTQQVFRRPYDEKIVDASEIELTEDQNNVYNNLLMQQRNGGGVSLLYGVTGSGKTKVYLKLIDAVLKTDKGIIVMVPEISLTPQILNLFHSRYGEKVAVFHSGLSNGERFDEWKRVKLGLAKIVVGTRSAVFAPFDNVGLIIVDEEQEHTYKSEQNPRYHARDIARYRCAEDKGLLLLVSATPSIESFTAAKQGAYTLNILKERYGTSVLPDVEIVDMTRERNEGNTGALSRSLLADILKTKEEGHQSIVLLNRRGYNTFASCDSCGEVVTCPNCSISLTYHRANNRLMCHYCGYSVPLTSSCPHCGENSIRYSGAGTQHFEEELLNLIPDIKILRMDADTTMQKYAYDEKLTAFRNKKYDIMIGTQMVAKGLDFENVTLVGVLSADQQLYNDDYMSMETTFDLITQVVGRAGRGEFSGKAIIQTINPENEVIKLASMQNYETFYNTEIMMRKSMIYPPFCNICIVSFQGSNEEKLQRASLDFFNSLRNAVTGEYADVKLIVLGPMPEPIYKISNKYRIRILIKCKNNKRFRQLLGSLLIEFGNNKKNSNIIAVPDII